MAKKGKFGGLSNQTYQKLHERNQVKANLVGTKTVGGGFVGSVTSQPSAKAGA